KAVTMFRRAGVRVLGAVENMSAFVCPGCGERISLFPTVAPDHAIWRMEVDKRGEIPFSRALGDAAQAGVPIGIAAPDSATPPSNQQRQPADQPLSTVPSAYALRSALSTP